jgi:cytochrome c-type biogenesis protein CcmH
MRIAAALLAVFLASVPVLSVPVLAAGADESTYVAPLADPVLEARAKALQKELRCLVCQGQSIDESNAPLATDLRRLIREQINAGQSDDQIKEFLVARYGVFVLMQPPVRTDTYLLWFGPMLLLLAGGAMIGVIIMRSRRRLATEPGTDAGEAEVS